VPKATKNHYSTRARLGVHHKDYGVTGAHYGKVALTLLWTLEQDLGDAFTSEVKKAWTQAYMLLDGIMQEAAVNAMSAPVAAPTSNTLQAQVQAQPQLYINKPM
jgi:hemoglobin-like flavoprotein